MHISGTIKTWKHCWATAYVFILMTRKVLNLGPAGLMAFEVPFGLFNLTLLSEYVYLEKCFHDNRQDGVIDIIQPFIKQVSCLRLWLQKTLPKFQVQPFLREQNSKVKLMTSYKHPLQCSFHSHRQQWENVRNQMASITHQSRLVWRTLRPGPGAWARPLFLCVTSGAWGAWQSESLPVSAADKQCHWATLQVLGGRL